MQLALVHTINILFVTTLASFRFFSCALYFITLFNFDESCEQKKKNEHLCFFVCDAMCLKRNCIIQRERERERQLSILIRHRHQAKTK